MMDVQRSLQAPVHTRPGPRRAAATLLVLVTAAASLWFLAKAGLDLPHTLRALERVDPWWLTLAIGASAAGYVGYAFILQAVVSVRDGLTLPLRIALQLTVAVFGASALVTSAGRLGMEYWSMRRLRQSPAWASARVIALNTASWAVLAFLTAAAALVLITTSPASAPLGLEVVWVLIPPLCLLLALLLVNRWGRLVWRRRLDGRLREGVRCLMRALSLVGRLGSAVAPRRRSIVGTLIYWGSELLVLWAALRAFGVAEPPANLVVGYTTGLVATMLPLPLGGVGGVEAAGVAGLTLVGVEVEPALLAILVQRLCVYWLPLGTAVVASRWLRSLRPRLDELAPEQARPAKATVGT